MKRLLPLFASLCLAVMLIVPAYSTAADYARIRIDEPMAVPSWARQERRLLELHSEFARVFDRAYLTREGHVRIDMEHGGGVFAPDDVLETLYKLPMYYALGAGEDTNRVWWKAWKGTIEQGSQGEDPLFVNEMPKYLDWHHNGEHFEVFWLGALCRPHDPEYRRLAVKYASLYDGSDRAAQNYNREKKIIPSMLHGGAGPQFDPTIGDWIEGKLTPEREEFWSHWLDCDHDGPVNLVTTNFGTIAFMLTGEEHWREVTVEYIDAWQKRAAENGGIIPSIVNRDGRVPAQWWGGVLGWDFTQFGGLLQVSSGPRAGWGNAVLLTGDTSCFDPMRTLSDELWEHRQKVEKNIGWGVKKGDWDVPRYRGEDGWHGGLKRAPGIYASMLANTWLATMREDDLRRILERRNIQGAAGHAHWQEGGYEPQWIRYLQGDNPSWPETALSDIVRRTERDLNSIKKEADLPLDKRSDRSWPRHWTWVGPMVNLMTGGPVPLWHGQLHMARFRYFDPERRRPGISRGCAALVEKLEDRSATLTLVNTDRKQSHTVLIQTGAYAEHLCFSVTPEGGQSLPVNDTVFEVTLAPRSGQRLKVKMNRYAKNPTLQFPWHRTNTEDSK